MTKQTPAPSDALQNIKRFDQLIAYLRDELDWPIETDDFDDFTFDYEPEELGIDPKKAAKIEIIKQLRPLTSDQPWGVFWINTSGISSKSPCPIPTWMVINSWQVHWIST